MDTKERIMKCLEETGINVLDDGTFENLDSIMFISLIIELECEFAIEFPDQYLLIENFQNTRDIQLLVENIVGNKS